MKPGFKTSEFFTTLIVIIIAGSLGLLCLMHSEQISKHIVGAISLLVAFLKAHSYNSGRVKIKIEELAKARLEGLIKQYFPDPTPIPIQLPIHDPITTPTPAPAPVPDPVPLPPVAPPSPIPDLAPTSTPSDLASNVCGKSIKVTAKSGRAPVITVDIQ